MGGVGCLIPCKDTKKLKRIYKLPPRSDGPRDKWLVSCEDVNREWFGRLVALSTQHTEPEMVDVVRDAELKRIYKLPPRSDGPRDKWLVSCGDVNREWFGRLVALSTQHTEPEWWMWRDEGVGKTARLQENEGWGKVV